MMCEMVEHSLRECSFDSRSESSTMSFVAVGNEAFPQIR